jgi:hypothetical protein
MRFHIDRAELVNLATRATANQAAGQALRVGRGSVEVRRLANLVTLCDGREVFFVAASGQIQMAANIEPRTTVESRTALGVRNCKVSTPSASAAMSARGTG